MKEEQQPLIALVGPTAVGKTAVGIALAQRLNGEIISADAVAVYKRLNIGAAKPSAREQAQTIFHLLDVADPKDDFTLADFEGLANTAIASIRDRSRVPLLVGGTGLYVRTVTATLTVPPVAPQPQLRVALWEEAEARGAAVLHARLAQSDPTAAAKILPNDAKRIIRALEVLLVTGQPMSSFHTPEGVRGVPRTNTTILGLRMDREDLYRRIEARVDAMLDAGFVEEVNQLLAAGYCPELKAMQSLGYRHICAYLSDTISFDQMVAELKRDTRRYAKRQISWFNADPQVVWLDLDAEPTTETVADQALAALQARGVEVRK